MHNLLVSSIILGIAFVAYALALCMGIPAERTKRAQERALREEVEE